MLKYLKEKKGQGIGAEYMLLFFLALAALTAMGTYIRRAYQARVMTMSWVVRDQASEAYGCDIALEYEPYYAEMESTTDSSIVDRTTGMGGGPTASIHNKWVNLQRTTTSTSTQMPPLYSEE